MHADMISTVLLAAWIGGSVVLGLGWAVWCGYSGERIDEAAAFVIALWPAMLLVIPICAAWMILSAPFAGAHWIGKKLAERRA